MDKPSDIKKTGIPCRVVIDCDAIKVLPNPNESIKVNGNLPKEKQVRMGRPKLFSFASSGILKAIFKYLIV